MWFKSMQGSGPEANPTGKRRMRSYATSIARDAGAYRPDGGSRFPSERSKLYSLAIFSLPSTRALGQSDHVEHHFDAKESAKSFDDPARDAWQIPDRVIAGLNKPWQTSVLALDISHYGSRNPKLRRRFMRST
jgi:hypothetical protein